MVRYIYAPCCVFLILTGVACSPPEEEKQGKDAKSPIERLLNGNKRYMTFHSVHPNQNRKRMIALSEEQNPFAIVVSCSDSRVPPEIIFDQGLGDLFVIRTAGNVIGDFELASIEYAIQKLKCKAVIILGHDKCGAIQIFVEQSKDSLPGHMNTLIDFIKKQPNAIKILEKSEFKYYHQVINNIIYGVNLVRNNSDVVKEKFDIKDLEIYGAIYHLHNGSVQIIEDELKK
jgi:carbonic anhydrase